MKKLSLTTVFGLIGALSWGLTVLLRGTSLNNIELIQFILGMMPNISAAWFFIWMGERLFEKSKKEFNFKACLLTSGTIFLLGLISEIIHDLFLDSPFDIVDIIATACAIIMYLAIFYISKKRKIKDSV
ncbi:hypothetical protein [Clostridium isatidis]|uniref:hypothetical protein n=1 Tax=Clostridium isatidis TaxID=182773 RepID=UPI00180DEF94|nr:hypothetical protein [Clostridiales bacterium]